jgi:integrase/recombinase XerD
VLSHEQVRRLLDRIGTDTAAGFRNRAMLELLYSSGIRAAELLGMDIDSVDFANATALVTGKGNKQRVVPVGRSALRYVETYLRAVRPYLSPAPGERALFLTEAGRRLPYFTLRRIVKACAAAAGAGTNVTAHTFRRSCTTELLRGGAGMYHVKELLGHESLETLKHYARLTITDLKKTHARCHPREREERQ